MIGKLNPVVYHRPMDPIEFKKKIREEVLTWMLVSARIPGPIPRHVKLKVAQYIQHKRKSGSVPVKLFQHMALAVEEGTFPTRYGVIGDISLILYMSLVGLVATFLVNLIGTL